MTGFYLTIAGGFPADDNTPLAGYAGFLSDKQRKDVQNGSGVRHANLFGAGTCYAAAAGRSLIEAGRGFEVGIICTLWPSALQPTAAFVDRACKAGPTLVNPLQFPATLPSAAATAVASALKGHAFAHVTGRDRLAFFDALSQAVQAIEFGFAERVFVLAASAVVPEALGVPRNGPAVDVAIGLNVSSEKGAAEVQLLGTWFGTPPEWGGCDVYSVENRNNEREWSFPPFLDAEAYGASGALLFLNALKYHRMKAGRLGNRFGIAFHEANRSAFAIFELQ